MAGNERDGGTEDKERVGRREAKREKREEKVVLV